MISKHFMTVLAVLTTWEHYIKEYTSKSLNVDFKYVNMCKGRIKQVLDRNKDNLNDINTSSALNKITEFYNFSEMKTDRITVVKGNDISDLDYEYIPNLSLFMQVAEEKIDKIKNIKQIDKSDIKSALKFWNKWLDNWTDTIR